MPVPFLIGTDGWSLFFHRPYNGRFDLREAPGQFLPEDDPDTPKERVGRRTFEVVLVESWENPETTVTYTGESTTVTFE